MANATPAVLQAALRQHFPTFIHRCFQTVAPGTAFLPNWHIDAIGWQLEQCMRGNIKRLIVTIPPRSGKSICASVAFPAFLLGHDPSRQLIAVSYSNELSTDFARQFRLVMNSPWYASLFPRTRANKDTDSEFVTEQGGCRLSTSVGGTLTGRGGDIIIIDDPIKPEDAASESARKACINWFQSTLLSRLNDKRNGVIIVIMQRLHEQDLVGHLLEIDPAGWNHLDLPAIATEPQTISIGQGIDHHREIGDLLHPEREPMPVLERLKANMGSAAFSAQYLQRPVPETGNIVKREWFRSYSRAQMRESSDMVVQSWDTALKPAQRNDPSVCTTWLIKGRSYYLLDVTSVRFEFPDLQRLVIDEYRKHQANAVLIEDAGSGTSLKQAMDRIGGINAIACKPGGDKGMRLHVQTAIIEAGRVYLPAQATWKDSFLHEVLGFPSVRHDDQVDSLSQFLKWADERQFPSFSYDFGWGDDIRAPSFEELAGMRWTSW